MVHRTCALAGAASIGLCVVGPASAGTVFSKDLAGFNAAAGNPAVAVSFDDIPLGTNIGGTTINGVTFNATGSPLIVVEGADTQTPATFGGIVDQSTNRLFPTSGSNVLSPGGGTLGPGPNAAVEEDDLELVFATPVRAVGFDHLSQSADGAGYTFITVFGAGDTQLFNGAIPISDLGGGGAPGGADFWGYVSELADITRIVIDETDGDANFPDANVGFDTLRVGLGTSPPPPPPNPIPLPAPLWMALSGLAAGYVVRRVPR